MKSQRTDSPHPIVKALLDCQRFAGTVTYSPVNTIHIDRNGRLIQGADTGSAQPETLSVVQPHTFQAGWEEAERRIAETKMPRDTRKVVTREGVRGWLYSFQNEFRDTYTMFAYFDGSFYQVKVIKPYLEDYFRSPQTGHIYGDGRICMGSGMNSGRRTLEDAYAKSVLWANGLSAMIHGKLDRFPFNYND